MKFTISAFPVIQWVFHTLGMDPAQRIMGFLWLGSFVIAQQITANSNRRLNAIMETCPVKILLIRPPAPAHERTPAGKRGPARRAVVSVRSSSVRSATLRFYSVTPWFDYSATNINRRDAEVAET